MLEEEDGEEDEGCEMGVTIGDNEETAENGREGDDEDEKEGEEGMERETVTELDGGD